MQGHEKQETEVFVFSEEEANSNIEENALEHECQCSDCNCCDGDCND